MKPLNSFLPDVTKVGRAARGGRRKAERAKLSKRKLRHGAQPRDLRWLITSMLLL